MGENTAVWLFETSTDIMKNTWGTWVTESVLPNDLVFYNLFSIFVLTFFVFQLNLQLYSVNFQSRPHFLCFSGKGISIKEFLVVFIYTTCIHLYPSIAPYPSTPSTQTQTDDESLTFHPKHMLETKTCWIPSLRRMRFSANGWRRICWFWSKRPGESWQSLLAHDPCLAVAWQFRVGRTDFIPIFVCGRGLTLSCMNHGSEQQLVRMT